MFAKSALWAFVTIVVIFSGRSSIVQAVEKLCGEPAEIALVLDSSASIWPYAFNQQLMPFLKDLVSSFEIGPDAVRFAVVTFGHEINKQHIFNFADYEDEVSLLKRLDTVKWLRGERTNTHLAVNYARVRFFTTARPGVKRIEIIVTDGKADNKASLAKEISKTKSADVKIFAVGVGKGVSYEDLKSMASDERLVFNVSSYAALEEIKDLLTASACVKPTTPPMIIPCGVEFPTDIIFTMDSSRMSITDTRGVFEFIVGVTREEDISHEGMRVGLLTGQCTNYGGFPLGGFIDKVSIGNYLDKLGQANVKDLVTELREEAFTTEHGDRTGVRRVGVVIIPSKLRDPLGLLEEAERAKADGIELFAIGIGDSDTNFLAAVASKPSSTYAVHVPNAISLAEFSSVFVKRICEKTEESGSTEAPPVTPKVTTTKKPTTTKGTTTAKATTTKPGC